MAGRPSNYIGNVTTTSADAYYDMPICEGVENMQCEYVLKDGTVITSDPTATRPS